MYSIYHMQCNLLYIIHYITHNVIILYALLIIIIYHIPYHITYFLSVFFLLNTWQVLDCESFKIVPFELFSQRVYFSLE